MEYSGSETGGISAENISHYFSSVSGDTTHVLEGISVDLRHNELLSVLGPSGCGKSTLLNIMAGLVTPSSGTVTVNGAALSGPGPDRAVVFQKDAVFPWYTVQQNLEYGPKMQGIGKSERDDIVRKVLEMVDLGGLEHLYPKELSGGMRKRVDLARAYASDPDIFLMDEPFGALDAQTKEKMQTELLALVALKPKSTLFVTHDIEEALFISDRVVVLSERPARVSAEIDVTFEKPRRNSLRTDPAFQSMRAKIRSLLSGNGSAEDH